MNTLEAYAQFVEQRELAGLFRHVRDKQACIHLDFSHNDSLGLSQNAHLIETAKVYAQAYGTGAKSARLLSQQQSLYGTIEQAIAQLKGTETALLFASGFQANVSAISALLDPSVLKHTPLVFTDKRIHASIHQGIQLAGCKQIRFHHQDLDHLQQRLEHTKEDPRAKFVFVESLYGMEGSVTDLISLKALCDHYQAFLYVDEAHAVGLYGEQGEGFCQPQVLMSMGNFAKALGSFGGFIACSHALKDYIMNRSQGFIYSTALPPMLLGAQKAALELLPQLSAQRAKVHSLADHLRTSLHLAGLQTTQSQSHIVCVLYDSVVEAQHLYSQLKADGILVSCIRPPTVPQPRLRISVNANHALKDIDTLVSCLKAYSLKS